MKLTATVFSYSTKKLFLICLFFVSVASSLSQAQEPVLINVMRLQLKPTLVEKFRAFHLNEVIPSQRAGGAAWRLTTTEEFGQSWTMTNSTPLDDFAQLDEETFVFSESGETLFGLSVESRERLVMQTRPDLGIAGDGTVLPLRRMAYMQVRQGKIPEFESFWAETVLPAMRGRGIDAYTIFQTLLGGSQGQYIGGMWLPNYAALDSLAMNTLLTPAQLAEFGDLVESFEVKIQSVDQELGYGFPSLQD